MPNPGSATANDEPVGANAASAAIGKCAIASLATVHRAAAIRATNASRAVAEICSGPRGA
jgi:hypothetical protein